MGIVTGASQDQLRLSTHKRRALFEKEMRSLHEGTLHPISERLQGRFV